MNKGKIIGLFTVVVFISSMLLNAKVGAAVYDGVVPDQITIKEDITHRIDITNLISDNTTFLGAVRYDPTINTDKRFNWKIQDYEKSDNFHVSEGDKKLKQADRIVLLIGSNPLLQLPDVPSWCLVYVNDVMARYSGDDEHRFAVFKYIHPYKINVTGLEDVDEFSLRSLNLVQEDGYVDYFDYLEHSTNTDFTRWTIEEKLATYNNTWTEGGVNQTDITLVFDKTSGFLNEMTYTASFINMTGFPAGINMTMIRLHGFGLPYNITTWVIWIPILLVLIGLIVAIRMRLFQRWRLYREARKLMKRE
jgi:hypothetical protein